MRTGIGDPDARRTRDARGRYGQRIEDTEPAAREIGGVLGPRDAERSREDAGAATELPRRHVGKPAPRPHQVDALERLEGSHQHRFGHARRSRHDVHHGL